MQIDVSKMFGNAISGASATASRSRTATLLRPDDKVGILFLNLGGPEKLDEVEDFLFNLFNDEDIIRLPNPLKPLQGEQHESLTYTHIRCALQHASTRLPSVFRLNQVWGVRPGRVCEVVQVTRMPGLTCRKHESEGILGELGKSCKAKRQSTAAHCSKYDLSLQSRVTWITARTILMRACVA